ncbi:hypothetical protein F400_gp108 [Bacillus phage BCD7]|uniref:Uncharacterized protein n=1 Tax=Bacillus phage BCD7 TaxID=1136534 RepID=J9PVC7_9CAUD|nr:hypothetical protein F400_gp108 [Bacillus phage BCD7]AEZ50555.1 hypothetical protein BCD7_0108 [Bacillus phage BCD7]
MNKSWDFEMVVKLPTGGEIKVRPFEIFVPGDQIRGTGSASHLIHPNWTWEQVLDMTKKMIELQLKSVKSTLMLVHEEEGKAPMPFYYETEVAVSKFAKFKETGEFTYNNLREGVVAKTIRPVMIEIYRREGEAWQKQQ